MGVLDLATARGDTETCEGMPRFPGHVLFVHVVTKTTQAGAVLGLVAGAATRALGRDVSIASWAAWGAIVGAPLGAAMVVAKASGVDSDGIVDRGYRLVHNEGQNTMDALSLGGLLVGLAASRRPPLGLSGAAVGVAAGAASYPIARKAGVTLSLPYLQTSASKATKEH